MLVLLYTVTILGLLSTTLPCPTCYDMVWNWKLAYYRVSLEVYWIMLLLILFNQVYCL